jgi:hypothetical protein
MPDSNAPRKQEHTDWPEHGERVRSNAQRQADYRARKKAAKEAESAEPGPAPEIPEDPEGIEPVPGRDPSVRDAVARSVAEWRKAQDPLAAIALGLAKTFDRAVRDGSASGAATVAERLTNTLDRLRPAAGAGSVPTGSGPAKVTDPAVLVERRKQRLADEAAKSTG